VKLLETTPAMDALNAADVDAINEEDFADQVVGLSIMPLRIEDEARHFGANFGTVTAFQPFAVYFGNLITGREQHSGDGVTKLVLQALEEKP